MEAWRTARKDVTAYAEAKATTRAFGESFEMKTSVFMSLVESLAMARGRKEIATNQYEVYRIPDEELLQDGFANAPWRERRGYPGGDTPHIITTRNTGTTSSLRNLSTAEKETPSSAVTQRIPAHKTQSSPHWAFIRPLRTRFPQADPHIFLFFLHSRHLLAALHFVFDPSTVFWRLSAPFETSYALQKSHDTLAADYRLHLALPSLDRHSFSGSINDTQQL